ncbi:dienelactone hydrolase family protein [Marinomonas sp. A79]|uniref:Dienelactone hydrolase family protein n=1 Tax=Marinomonas vulgaris TaxID=2823372 RepID=A0ABS5H9S4_9GAMM|nr:alpha/beta family hydrolase [Marinomonas vulgaris]MBR7888426.1 dienelactone hydrolase family protein [Marinomonas vulgaris]
MESSSFYLAHGAGAGHQSAFLTRLSKALSSINGLRVTPLTFGYMKDQEITGKKRPPPKFPTLIPEFEHAITDEQSCIIAGKSMGGRVATQVSHLPSVKAIVCFGFPFYPVGKPEKHRLAFLEHLEKPCLIIQGTRDKLGAFEWVSMQALPELVKIVWIEGADHDFKVLKKYNKSEQEIVNELASVVESWLEKQALIT